MPYERIKQQIDLLIEKAEKWIEDQDSEEWGCNKLVRECNYQYYSGQIHLLKDLPTILKAKSDFSEEDWKEYIDLLSYRQEDMNRLLEKNEPMYREIRAKVL